MISIQLWRARIGLFNAKRHSGPRPSFSSESSSGSSSLTLALLHKKSSIPPTAHSPTCDSPPGSSTDKHVPSTGHDHEHKCAFSTETSSTVVSISHGQSAVYTNSKISARLESKTVHSLLSSLTDRLYLPSDLLKDALVMLLITIISQLLVLSGDVETNPGPIASDKPTMNQLISLKKTDGSGEYLRIIRWIASLSRSECMDFAHLLLNDPVKVRKHQKLSNSDDFVRAVLEDWLSSGDDSRAVPCTWEALADCMEAAGLPGDLVKAIRETFPSGSPQVQIENEDVNMPPAKKLMVSSHSDTIEGSTMEHAPVQVLVKPDIPKELLALMEEYSDMLVVLQTARLSKERLSHLKLFLAGYCDEKSFKKCPSPEEIVEQLKLKLKIHIFNIDTLTACCKHFRNSKVSQCIQQYKENLNTFLSTTSVKELQSSLLTDEITCLDDTEPLTLKLNETASDDTLMNLKKLVYHFFGHSSKALVIRNIHSGCVCVTWIVPASLVSTLKAKAQQLSSEYLASRGVLELVIGLRIAPIEEKVSDELKAQWKEKLWVEEKILEIELKSKKLLLQRKEEMLLKQGSMQGLAIIRYLSVVCDDWLKLGTALGIPLIRLHKIELSYPQGGPRQWMAKMIQYWVNTTSDADWKQVVDALEKIGQFTLASTIVKQYLWDQPSPAATAVPTFQTMIHHLIEAYDKWYAIGIGLRIRTTTLDRIKALCDDKPKQCMAEMVEYWLNTTPNASWEEVTRALRQRDHICIQDSAAEYFWDQQHAHHASTFMLRTSRTFMNVEDFYSLEDKDSVPTLWTLLQHLDKVHDKWFEIGVALGLPPKNLRKIRGNSHGRQQRWMAEMIQQWLESNHDASWKQVVSALEKVNLFDLARNIDRQYMYSMRDEPTIPADLVPTFQTMFRHLSIVSDDWYMIGIALGILLGKLQHIEVSHQDSEPKHLMAKMIQYWLDNTPSACWEQVAKALEQVGHSWLALNIKRHYLLDHVPLSKDDQAIHFEDSDLHEDDDLEDSDSVDLQVGSEGPAIFCHLIEAHADWHMIGISLDIPISKLHSIKSLYLEQKGSKQCMFKMIQYWLQGTTARTPTDHWEQVVRALEQVCRFTLASAIKQEHLNQTPIQKLSPEYTSTAELVRQELEKWGREGVADSTLSLQSMLHHLHVICADWLKIGRALGVSASKLRKIEAPYQHCESYLSAAGRLKQQMAEMIQYWLDNTPDASWEQVVRALEHIGHFTLALTIKQQFLWDQPTYGVQQSEHTAANWWKEIHQVTPAPPYSPVRLEEVPHALDWKFLDKQLPIEKFKRHYVFLNQAVYLPGPIGLRVFCSEKHFVNMARFTKIVDDIVEDVMPPSGYEYQCSAQLGKIAWYIDEELLHEHQQQPLTLERFTEFFESQKISKGKTKYFIKEDFFPRVTTDLGKMLTKLGAELSSQPLLEHYLQLQLFNREDERIMYRVKVTEEQVTHGSTFQLSDLWSPRTLRERKGDFLCFGRAHDIRITCRCATDEMPEDVRSDIEAVVNSCTRNKEGNLEMILKTNKVVVGHVFDRIVHKFSTRDGWFVNYITHTDHFIDKESQSEGVVTPLPPGHHCQNIEVMLQQTGTERPDRIKEKVFKMVDFSLDLVDMAEECLDPERQ